MSHYINQIGEKVYVKEAAKTIIMNNEEIRKGMRRIKVQVLSRSVICHEVSCNKEKNSCDNNNRNHSNLHKE